jgi:hypothetical protein
MPRKKQKSTLAPAKANTKATKKAKQAEVAKKVTTEAKKVAIKKRSKEKKERLEQSKEAQEEEEYSMGKEVEEDASEEVRVNKAKRKTHKVMERRVAEKVMSLLEKKERKKMKKVVVVEEEDSEPELNSGSSSDTEDGEGVRPKKKRHQALVVQSHLHSLTGLAVFAHQPTSNNQPVTVSSKVRGHLKIMMNSVLTQATTKIYRSAWEEYTTFHTHQYHRAPSFPVSEEKILMFIVHLDLKSFARSTIRTYTSAIAYSHRLSNKKDPTAGSAVKKVLEVAGSLAVQRPRKRPIVKEILQQLITVSSRIFTP